MPRVKGFHIEEDGTRVVEFYGSQSERLRCECEELVEHEHFNEAREKLDALHDLGMAEWDWKMMAKIEIGCLSVKPSQQKIGNAVKVWAEAASRDCGDYADTYVEMADEVIEKYCSAHKIPVNCDNFEEANVKQTVQLLDFIYESFLVPGADSSMNLEEYGFFEPVKFGIRHLAEKGEMNKAKVMYKKIVKAGSGHYKSFMEAEKPFMMNQEITL